MDSARFSGLPRLLAFLAGAVEGGAAPVEGGGDEVSVDLVGDLDALNIIVSL
jgi:hypothetical protein